MELLVHLHSLLHFVVVKEDLFCSLELLIENSQTSLYLVVLDTLLPVLLTDEFIDLTQVGSPRHVS